MKPKPRAQEVMGYTHRGSAWELRQSWFVVFFFTYFLYWVPLVYMGLRVLQFRWVIYGLLYAGPAAVLALVLGAGDATRWLWGSTTAFLIFAFIHTMRARGEFLVRLSEAQVEHEELVERIQQRIALQQEEAGEPAAPSPRRLLDLNTATEAELMLLPGFGPAKARQAIELRRMQGGFRSFSHFAEQLQIPVEARERLRAAFHDAPGPAAPPPVDPAFRVLPDGARVLELNWASAEAIAALPGLGPEVGRRAAAQRDSDGPFKSLEDFRFRLGLPMDAIIKMSPYVSVISMSTVPGGGTGRKTGGRIVDV